jgi:hypothetical protein
MLPLLKRIIRPCPFARSTPPILSSLFMICMLCPADAPAQPHPLVIHPGQHAASLQLTPAEYRAWIDEDGFNDPAARKALVKEIYGTFRDEFDFIFLVLNEPKTPSNLGYVGELITVSNQVSGIGQTIFDRSADYGSAGKLKSVMAIAVNYGISDGPSLHEMMHNWANFGIQTADFDSTAGGAINEYRPHWGFTGGSSPGQLGGFRQDSLVANVNGNPKRYRTAPFLPFINGVNTVPYNQLELYLMGVIPVSAVAPFDVFRDITAFEGYPKPQFEFEADTRIRYDSARIIAELGPRVPSFATSQKSFRLLTVMITGAPLTDSAWASIERQAEVFGRPASEGTYNHNFWEATGGRATVETGNLNNALKGNAILARPSRRKPAEDLAYQGEVGYDLLGRQVRFTRHPLHTGMPRELRP